ncbi:hypothetical protein [Bradyrhizobium sp. USDA 4353]
MERHFDSNIFAVGPAPTIADVSMQAYLSYPGDEHGYDLPANFPATFAWLERLRSIPGWTSAYDLLPGHRLTNFAR